MKFSATVRAMAASLAVPLIAFLVPLLVPFLAALLALTSPFSARAGSASYVVVDTGQSTCFSDTTWIACPRPSLPFSGQDAQYQGNRPVYRDNGDGTITDLNTGLMWVKARGREVTWKQAVSQAADCRAGGYSDWRMPTIKELYSLIDFNGYVHGSGQSSGHGSGQSTPFLDAKMFDFAYGDVAAGKRAIDCQDWSATRYQGTTMNGNPTVFGVNFADGRIKGYPESDPHRGAGRHYVRYVRGNPHYGLNRFTDNQDGTIADMATTLVWQKSDSGRTFDWEDALDYCQGLDLAGHTDWRLPNAKELQSIVDYSRGPDSTGLPAIDPVFGTTEPESYFWSSTTHLDGPLDKVGSQGVYVAFGRALGSMGSGRFMDVHGAGAQRSDPKSGDPADYATGFGPQGDDRRINNFARCVRAGGVVFSQPRDQALIPPSIKVNMDAELRNVGPDQGRSGQADRGAMPEPRKNGPPPEARKACASVETGHPCSFAAPHGTVYGACARTPQGLACVPAGGKGRGGD